MAVKSQSSIAGTISLYVFYGLLAYMPFHVFLSTWVGSSFGVLELAKVAKEPVLVVGFLAALYSARNQLTVLLEGYKKIFWLIAAYALISVISVLLKPNELDAEVLGLAYNSRFLVFFLYAILLVRIHGQDVIYKAANLVLITGSIVALLGVLQVAVLPDHALNRFGYSKANGTPEAFYISPITKETERAYSTLKDPNSLGSYLIIILSLGIVYGFSNVKKTKRLLVIILIVALSLACLYLTYSRSSLVGLVAALAVLAVMIPSVRKFFFGGVRKYVSIVAAIALPAIFLYALSGTFFFQNVVLHDVEGKQQTSNTLRLDAYRRSLQGIADNPLGYGVGSAGPVSFKNESKGAMIPENYYLQIALEVGIIGLVVFMAIVLVIGFKVLRLGLSGNLIAVSLLVSLVGISIANMFNHIWANEAVAYTWWGLAGLVLASKPRKPAKTTRQS